MPPHDILYRPDPSSRLILAHYRLLIVEIQETIDRSKQLIEESRELLRGFDSPTYSHRTADTAPERRRNGHLGKRRPATGP